MKNLESVKVGPYQYRVERPEKIVDGPTVYFGRHDRANLIVRIASAYHPDQQDETFFHEFLHAINEIYDVGMKESQIARLSVGLTAFLKDNDLLKD